MTGINSEYPSAIDPPAVTLRGGHDFLPVSALQWAIAMLSAIQNEVGLDPTLFTGISALHYGLISTFMEANYRIDGGTAVITGNSGDVFPVPFAADRFTAPPMVLVQRSSFTSIEPNLNGKFNAKNITKDGFEMGSHYTNTHIFGGEPVKWVAIQPPFGIEGREE